VSPLDAHVLKKTAPLIGQNKISNLPEWSLATDDRSNASRPFLGVGILAKLNDEFPQARRSTARCVMVYTVTTRRA